MSDLRTIRAGDSYILPIQLKQSDNYVTPSVVDDVRIQIGNVLRSYSDGTLTFNGADNTWLYLLTQEQTANPQFGILQGQVRLIKDGGIYNSRNFTFVVENSIIKYRED